MQHGQRACSGGTCPLLVPTVYNSKTCRPRPSSRVEGTPAHPLLRSQGRWCGEKVSPRRSTGQPSPSGRPKRVAAAILPGRTHFLTMAQRRMYQTGTIWSPVPRGDAILGKGRSSSSSRLHPIDIISASPVSSCSCWQSAVWRGVRENWTMAIEIFLFRTLRRDRQIHFPHNRSRQRLPAP
jgi:hypothetical protein